MGADGMDGNERLLSQVLQERSAHGRLRGPGSGWMLLGSVVLVFLAVGVLFRIIGSTGGVPAPGGGGWHGCSADGRARRGQHRDERAPARRDGGAADRRAAALRRSARGQPRDHRCAGRTLACHAGFSQ